MRKTLRCTLCACLLCCILTGSSAQSATQLLTEQPSFVVAQKPNPTEGVIAPLPTPTKVITPPPHIKVTPTVQLPVRSNNKGYYTSSDVISYLQKKYPIQATFPPSFNFGSLYPQDYLGFTDASYTYVIVVYATHEDAHSGYLYLLHTTKDAFYWYNRCVLGGPSQASSAMDTYYQAMQAICTP